jgi:hypothetical protein
MAGEPTPDQPTELPEKLPSVVSLRFKNQAQAERFAKVFNYRKQKGKSATVSDLIWQMFEYIEKNPYSDFPTGR